MNAGHRVTILCAAFTLVSALAHAQSETTRNNGSPETDSDRRLQEVVVTGSRIEEQLEGVELGLHPRGEGVDVRQRPRVARDHDGALANLFLR